MTVNEAQTRCLQIDPQLRAADWKLKDHTQVRLEVPVDGYDAEPWNGVTDYCLYDASGNVLAVVEAKRCSRNAREADEQLRYYVTEIAKKQPFAPFGFMANGHDIWFWEVGLANPRLVAGFFAPPDLERLKFLRENRRPLEATPINSSIVDRSYQHEAIRRLAEAFAANKRRALLVMATGTGKTRVAMALIDVFLRAHQAQNVLFLADRDALVDQTLTDGFKAHLPHEPRDRVYTHQIDKTKRLFVATEQTLALCYAKFSPGFFDLIIFDEAHRSLFKRFTEVIEYFDARMIGLTATPANFIDRDTFRLFGCDANVPTFLYDYPQAVKERFLVDFILYQAHTSFQRKGIKGVDLSEEDRNALAEQGIDPDSLMLHGIAAPNFRYTDTLSKAFAEERAYDVVLANPPFKGAIDAADVNPTLPVKCKKTEILFLHLFLRLLENGGRAAVIVPDGVLFGSSNAHVDIRKKLIEENRLDGVVSMPSGVFRPYAGVSTAVLLFTKGGTTEKIWFYDMEHDGYSLDDKRQKVPENDIPDVLDCWNQRWDAKFQQKRAQRLADLQEQIAPLKKDRLEHHAIIHRLKFEEVVSKTADKARDAREKAEAELAELQTRMTSLQTEINQLTRQFWVTKEQVKANKYDLSASRYRQVEQDEEFYEEPRVTLDRLRQLEAVAIGEVTSLGAMLDIS